MKVAAAKSLASHWNQQLFILHSLKLSWKLGNLLYIFCFWSAETKITAIAIYFTQMRICSFRHNRGNFLISLFLFFFFVAKYGSNQECNQNKFQTIHIINVINMYYYRYQVSWLAGTSLMCLLNETWFYIDDGCTGLLRFQLTRICVYRVA